MSTTGIELKTQRRALAETVEIISSMRFAICMFVILIIASSIGTVMKQNEPMTSYVDKFGPFWFEVFNKTGLYAVYSAWWFLLFLGLLISSTALCIIRNGPKMIKDMRSWRENLREVSLHNFHHKSEWTAPLPRAALAQQTLARLADAGYAAKLVEKDGATLVAAKKGAVNKLGYIFAHSAIIIILLGGMLDSDLPIRFQQTFMGKTPFAGSGVIADIPAQHRLGLGNPTFRGNTQIPEGGESDTAIIPQASGVLVQDLPFTIRLKKFNIDFYSTGMPKLFASEVVIRDHATGETFPATIEVNKPLIYKGVAVYQSSFDDGGSKLTLTGFPMVGAGQKSFPISGQVGASTDLKSSDAQYAVEWTGFRPFNVENLGNDPRAVAKGKSLNEELMADLDKHSGSAAKNANNKDLKNVGPSVQYKLRDKSGQAREYQNYMQPLTINGDTVFLAGMRANPGDAFSYLRIPADDAHTVKEWMRLRAALADPALRAIAAARHAARAFPLEDPSKAALQQQLRDSNLLSLATFAGDGSEANPGGYTPFFRLLETRLGDKMPAAEKEKIAEVVVRTLHGSLWELWQAAREKDGLAAVAADEAHLHFMQLAAGALSDSFFYGAPVYLQLDDFNEVKASVLQVSRSPGKPVVYLGCLFLIIGVFSMFYIQERRLWVWLRDNDDGAGASASALMAMSTQRKTLAFEQEFTIMAAKLAQSA